MASEPPKTVVVKLNNVSITNLKPILDPLLSPKRDKTETSPEVRGGSIVLNSFSNEIIITDSPQVAEQVAAMAKRLDVEPRQVVIETKFIEVSRSLSREMGVRFSTNNTFSGSPNTLTTGSLGAGVTPETVGTFNAFFDSQDLKVALRMLAANSRSKIISNPTVIAISGRPSVIEVKRLEPTVDETVGNGDNSKVARKIVYDEKIYEGVSLKVTPNISTNDLVSLGIEAEKQDLPQNSRIDAADLVRRKAQLEMIIKNGYTAAIGGLLDTVNDKSNSRIPVLGDIPVVGNLFKQKQSRETERNLMVFITASILEPSKTTYDNLVSPSRLRDLDLTARDLEGVTYNKKISPEERELLDRNTAARKAKQDAEILNSLQDKPQGRRSKE
jgi:general secretion pathway protein D